MSFCDFIQEFFLLFFIKNNFDITKISFLFWSSAFCVISDSEVSSCLSNQTTMNPKSHRVKASLLGMIYHVPESSNHKFSDLFMAVHQHVNSVQNIKSFNWVKGCFTFFDWRNDVFSGGWDSFSGEDWFRFHDRASFDLIFWMKLDIEKRMINSDFDMIIGVAIISW